MAASPLTRQEQTAAAEEITAIREQLAAAGIPAPFVFGGGPGYTAAWVGVALAELAARREREKTQRREADRAAAEQEAERRHRGLASERVAGRASRAGCPRPDKAAYDIHDEHERSLITRRRHTGMNLYHCRRRDGSGCGWWHLGNPTADVIPDAPELPDAPILWARTSRQIVLYTGGGGVYAEGRCVAYEADPTVKIRLDDGTTVSWRADLARPASSDPPEAA